MISVISKKNIVFPFMILILMATSAPLAIAKIPRCESSIQGKFDCITPLQQWLFNIKASSWVSPVPDNPVTPADESMPGYGFIAGCHDCEGAAYNEQGALTNVAELTKIPTSWIIKMPENWNGKLLEVIPPSQGQVDQVSVFTNLSFLNTILKEGYAVASMNHPAPGFVGGWTYNIFIEKYKTKDFRNEYFTTAHILKYLVLGVFGPLDGTYGYSQSRGTLLGTGLLAGLLGNPFDGFVMATGGNGYLEHLMTHIEAYTAVPNRVFLTNLTPLASETTAAQKVTRLTGLIEVADPEYRSYILSGATADEQLARAMAYDVFERPIKVKIAWAALEHGADLRKPTIYIQGLKDRTVFPDATLAYAERVVAEGRSDLMRLYLIKNMTHGGVGDPPLLPNSLMIDAIHALDDWVQKDIEPGSLNVGAALGDSRESCASRGFESDPFACFCDEMEGVDFGGNAIPECD